MGTIYEDYILTITGLKEAVSMRDSSALNVSIEVTFKNDPWQTYSHLVTLGDVFPFEGAAINIYEVYKDAAGNFYTDKSTARDRLRAEIFQLAEIQMPVGGPLLLFSALNIDLPASAAKVLLFKGVLDQPRLTDLMQFKCSCSALEYHLDRLFQQSQINQDDYPNALEDVGKIIPIIYGDNLKVPALRADWGARSTLIADIDEDDTSMTLSDASRFPSSGTVIVNIEEISYSGKTNDTLTGLSRAQSSTLAAIHGSGIHVLQKLSSYRSVLADHALKAVLIVWAELPDGRLVRVPSGYSTSVVSGRQVLDVSADAELEFDEEVNVKAANIDAGTNKDNLPYPSMPAFINMPSGGTPTVSANTPAPTAPGGKLSNIYSEINWVAVNDSDGTYNYYVGITLVATLGPYAQRSGTVIIISASYPILMLFQINRVNTPTIFNAVSMELQSGFVWSSRATNTKKGSQARVVRYHAIVDGYASPASDYGTVGTVIERPDYVIKHFLVHRLGFSLAEINSASFDAAGVSYAAAISGGYKLSFEMDKAIKFASRETRDMAYEVRSVLYFSEGQWELDFLPDAAPAADFTISKGDVAGKDSMFVFSASSSALIFNYYEANYERNYSRTGDDSQWNGNSIVSDATSITKYGERRKKLDFKYVRLSLMITDILDLYLKQTDTPLRTVEFDVFFDLFELLIGDTIEIDNDIYDGELYFIENVDRVQKETARIRGRQWWS